MEKFCGYIIELNHDWPHEAVKYQATLEEYDGESIIHGRTIEDVKNNIFDLDKVDNVDIDGIDTKDYPDFSDAFICSADYDGVEMTESELDYLNDNYPEFVHEETFNKLF